MLSCLVAACLLSSSSSTFDFKPGADNLRTVVAQLAQASGEKLAVDGEIAHEVVFVLMSKADSKAIRDELANAVVGTWVEKDGGFILERTPVQKNQIWKQHLEYRRKEVDRALAEMEKELEKPFDARALADGLRKLPDEQSVRTDPQAARVRQRTYQQLVDMGPLARLMRRMLLACDRNDLASIGPFERRVFRFRANKRQGKMNEAAFRTAAAQFAKEQAAWVDTATANPFPEDRGGRTVSDPRSQTRISEKAALDAELVVSRGERAELLIVNLNGPPDGLTRHTLCQLFVADASRNFLNSFGEGMGTETNDPFVTFSRDSQIIADAIRSLWSQDRSYAPSPELLDLVGKVDEREPLQWITGDVLTAYAVHKRINVVAVLPDQAFIMAMYGGTDKVRVLQSVNNLVKSGTLHLEATATCHRFVPVDRWEAALDYTWRPAMSKMIRSVIEKGRLDMRDYATYAFESRRLNRGGLADAFVMMVDNTLMGTTDFTSWDGMRLYGSFMPKARQDLEAGGSINYAGMSAVQKQIVERIIYRDVIQSEERLDRHSSSLNHAPVEPTDAFPNNLPPNTQVVSKVNAAETIVAYGRDKNGKVKILRSLNPWTLATAVVDGLDNPQVVQRYGLSNLVGFAPGTDRLLSLRIVVGPGLWKETPFVIPDYDEKARPAAWEKLPEGLRKQVEDGIKQVQQQRQNQGGGTTPPP